MVRLLLRTAVFLGSAALGLLAAALLVDGVRVTASGLVVTVVVFAVAQSLLAPLAVRATTRYAPALLGGVGVLSTFVALLLARLLTSGLRISGVAAWVLATLVVWVVTALATVVLPLVLRRADRPADGPPTTAGRRRGRRT